MNRTAHKSGAICVLAILGMVAQPAFADPKDGEDIGSAIETSARAEPELSPHKPAISIQKPVGKVVISRAGDDLGAVRYGRRTDGDGITVVSFLRSTKLPAVAAGPLIFRPTSTPLRNARLTSNFGYRRDPINGGSRWHSGVDLAAPTGTPIMATSDGLVNSAGWRGGYGIAVVLDHGNGVQTLYGHMSRLTVQSGERVQAGQVIGLVGSTGRSTGPHLHYEIRKDGRPVRPM